MLTVCTNVNWLALLGTGDEEDDGRDEEGKLYLHNIVHSGAQWHI